MEYKVKNETTQMSLSLPSPETETKLLFFEHLHIDVSEILMKNKTNPIDTFPNTAIINKGWFLSTLILQRLHTIKKFQGKYKIMFIIT